MTSPASALETQKQLVSSLIAGRGLPPNTLPLEHLQTHISHILLAGDIAYKLKKPLNLGFLDFTGLDRRRHCCEEEVRLNRRLAPQLYLDSIAICGTPDNPTLGGAPQDAIEFAVRMQQFDRTQQFDELVRQGLLGSNEIIELAHTLAAFHQDADADRTGRWGAPEAVHELTLDNFRTLRPLLAAGADQTALERLETWTQAEFERIFQTLQRRATQLSVRECHGDLHLGNIVLIGNQPVVFDCIEFSESLRWIDVMSEIAFLYMDLVYWQRRDLADLLLDRYLENTGDYDGLMVLPYYLVYRALVRAKIAAIRAQQTAPTQTAAASVEEDLRQHLTLAQQLAEARQPFLAITHGVSGSGKSTVADFLIKHRGALRLRSDVLRKRLFGLAPTEQTGAPTKGGIYSDSATKRTYARLEALADQILAAGWPVVVDATNLMSWQRMLFRTLANNNQVRFLILDCRAPKAVLRKWIKARLKTASDPSEADESVLRYQFSNEEPLAQAELAQVIRIRTDQTDYQTQLDQQLAEHL